MESNSRMPSAEHQGANPSKDAITMPTTASSPKKGFGTNSMLMNRGLTRYIESAHFKRRFSKPIHVPKNAGEEVDLTLDEERLQTIISSTEKRIKVSSPRNLAPEDFLKGRNSLERTNMLMANKV